MSKHFPLSVALILVSSSVFAIAPATKEQQLCAATFLVKGNVIGAARSSAKCAGPGVPGVVCAPGRAPGFANLTINVTEVLGVKNIVTKFPREVGIANGRMVDIYIYDPKLEDPSVSSVDVSNMFVGKALNFGIAVQYGDVLKDGIVMKNHLGEPPFYSRIWAPDDQNWIRKVVSTSDGSACPK
jgi:hypothetical protein